MERGRVNTIKSLVKRTPVLRDLSRLVMRRLAQRQATRFDSARYWENRYAEGRNSGAGSYNRLARFKAEIINDFVARHHVRSVIEFGCGDGSQLELAHYPSYIGIDVSPTVLAATADRFATDATKRFVHSSEVRPEHRAELALSLDVIYHLVEDAVFDEYMRQLFDSATRFVIIYSSNEDRVADSVHVRHRRFTDWIESHRPDFRETGVVKNRFPEDIRDPDNTSFADFYFFERDAEAIQA
jgi:hypothetical protein